MKKANLWLIAAVTTVAGMGGSLMLQADAPPKEERITGREFRLSIRSEDVEAHWPEEPSRVLRNEDVKVSRLGDQPY